MNRWGPGWAFVPCASIKCTLASAHPPPLPAARRLLLLLLPLLALGSLTLAACDSASDGVPVSFSVHLTTRFSGEHVRVFVDDAVILDDTLTTRAALGLAAFAGADVRPGKRRIRVEIDGQVRADRHVRVGNGSRGGCATVAYAPPGEEPRGTLRPGEAGVYEGCPRFYY